MSGRTSEEPHAAGAPEFAAPDWEAVNTLIGYNAFMSETLTYRVPGMHCGHCEAAVKEEVGVVAGVHEVNVDLAAKTVVVRGVELDDAALRTAIGEAGYQAA